MNTKLQQYESRINEQSYRPEYLINNTWIPIDVFTDLLPTLDTVLGGKDQADKEFRAIMDVEYDKELADILCDIVLSKD